MTTRKPLPVLPPLIYPGLKSLVVCIIAFFASAAQSASIELHARSRPSTNEDTPVLKTLAWDPLKTAIVVCDMWDQHWCKGATTRVGEMAPRMNEVLRAAREKGVFIIHCPSSTMGFYKDTPQRKLAQAAPIVTPKTPLKNWCSLDPAREPSLPFDDSDGGCDDQPQCKQANPWSRQIATLEIASGDAITDSSEAYNLMQQRGIENVIVMGVHANMCVLGRPFSIRQMIYQGKNVVLMQDMTDTMYNSRMKPWVNHFQGTALLVAHIEKYWCPSITSVDFLGGQPFTFSADKPKQITFIIGENEYHTWETLPEFARRELEFRGFKTTFVTAPPAGGNDFTNFETIRTADLLVVSTRRRTPPSAMMELIRGHIKAGKPVIGIRTASHAFDAKPADSNHLAWPAFDAEVLGGDYQGHYDNKPSGGKATVIEPVAEAMSMPIMTGLASNSFNATTHLYKNPHPKGSLTVLLRGHVEGMDELQPVAWINTAAGNPVFYTSLGAPDDFKIPAFRRLLLNATLWTLNQPIPPAQLSLR